MATANSPMRLHQGAHYTPEEVAFMLAMHGLARRLGRQPTAAEVLAAAKALGYERPPPGPSGYHADTPPGLVAR